jgi:hypothetical protein
LIVDRLSVEQSREVEERVRESKDRKGEQARKERERKREKARTNLSRLIRHIQIHRRHVIILVSGVGVVLLALPRVIALGPPQLARGHGAHGLCAQAVAREVDALMETRTGRGEGGVREG